MNSRLFRIGKFKSTVNKKLIRR